MSQQPYNYQCKYCTRKYNSKFYLDRHITGCEFFNKSAKEQFDEVDSCEAPPNAKDMYRFIQELAVRITSLEQDNLKLKQQLNKKVQILDWLNNTSTIKPPIYFEDWFTNVIIPKIPKLLNVVFMTNLVNGINTLFNNEFDAATNNSLPIRAFHQHQSTLFIYQKSTDSECGKWTKISMDELIPWFRMLCKQFIIDFNSHWCLDHADKLENDETYKDLYINYYYKILGNNVDNSVIYSKIRLNIFSKIKENLSYMN
jgi:hypothetical protein